MAFDPLFVPLNARPADLTQCFPPLGIPTILAAAGSTQGTAAALTDVINDVTGANGVLAVVLPITDRANQCRLILNRTAGILPVFPGVGGSINGGGANAALNLAAQSSKWFYQVAVNTWVTLG